MAALVPAVAAVAWRLLSPRVAVLAGALIVVNGSVAGYAQNARTYALSMLLATLATLFFVLDVEQPRRWTIVSFWGAGVLLAYSHIVGLLLLAALVGSLWFLPPDQRLVKRRTLASGIIVLASLPMAYLIATHDEGMPLSGFRLGAFRDVLFTMTGRAGYSACCSRWCSACWHCRSRSGSGSRVSTVVRPGRTACSSSGPRCPVCCWP